MKKKIVYRLRVINRTTYARTLIYHLHLYTRAHTHNKYALNTYMYNIYIYFSFRVADKSIRRIKSEGDEKVYGGAPKGL